MVYYSVYISLYFLFCFVISVFAGLNKTYDICLTPEKQSGKCVVLAECPSLLNLLKQRPIPPEYEERLKRANCGFQGTHPKVCCSENDFAHTDLTTHTPIVVATEQPIPDYPLSDLLPNLDDCGYFIEDRVLHGDETQLDAYPWMVLLEYEKPTGRDFHCGGVLINDRYVLTAAHCIMGKGGIDSDSKLVSVRLGEYDRDSDPDCESFIFAQTDCCCTDPVVNVEIEEKIVHEQYQPDDQLRYHDIGLLRLAHKIKFSDFIKPICLQPTSHLVNNSRPGDISVISGWGITDLRSNSHKKQSARMQIKDNADCELAYSKKRLRLRDDQICAFAANNMNACSGDSGGVLMNGFHETLSSKNYFAVGVMSIGYPICGLTEYPVIYTKVEKYIPWIIEKLKP